MQQLNVMAILKEAWALTRQQLNPLLGAVVLSFVILFVAALLLLEFYTGWQGIELSDPEQINEFVAQLQLPLLILFAPFEAALAYMGWRRATGQKVEIRALWQTWLWFIPLGLIALLTSMLVSLGLVLLIPGLYLMVVLSQANLHYVLAPRSAFKAMLESAKRVHSYFFSVLLLYMSAIAILLIATIPMGLGLVLAVPFFFHMKGVLFRELFPELSPQARQAEPQEVGSPALDDDSRFDA